MQVLYDWENGFSGPATKTFIMYVLRFFWPHGGTVSHQSPAPHAGFAGERMMMTCL